MARRPGLRSTAATNHHDGPYKPEQEIKKQPVSLFPPLLKMGGAVKGSSRLGAAHFFLLSADCSATRRSLVEPLNGNELVFLNYTHFEASMRRKKEKAFQSLSLVWRTLSAGM